MAMHAGIRLPGKGCGSGKGGTGEGAAPSRDKPIQETSFVYPILTESIPFRLHVHEYKDDGSWKGKGDAAAEAVFLPRSVVDGMSKRVSGQHVDVVLDTKIMNTISARRVVEHALRTQKLMVVDVAVRLDEVGKGVSPALTDSYLFLWRARWEETRYMMPSDASQSFDRNMHDFLGRDLHIFVSRQGRSATQYSSTPADMRSTTNPLTTTSPLSSTLRSLSSAPPDVFVAMIVALTGILLFVVRRFVLRKKQGIAALLHKKITEPMLVTVIGALSVFIVVRILTSRATKQKRAGGRTRNLEKHIIPRHLMMAPWVEHQEQQQQEHQQPPTRSGAPKTPTTDSTSDLSSAAAAAPPPNRVLVFSSSETVTNAELTKRITSDVNAVPKSVTNNPQYWRADAGPLNLYRPLPTSAMFIFFRDVIAAPKPAYTLRFTNPSGRKMFETRVLKSLSHKWNSFEVIDLRAPRIFPSMIEGFTIPDTPLSPPERITTDPTPTPVSTAAANPPPPPPPQLAATTWHLNMQARLTSDSRSFELRCLVHHEDVVVCFDRKKDGNVLPADLLHELRILGHDTEQIDMKRVPDRVCLPKTLTILEFARA